MEKLRKKIRQAQDSGTSEGRIVAELVGDLLDNGEDHQFISAVMDEVIEWAQEFKKACK